MYRIGLTGGVGCGKSTVSSYMARLGIPVIDGDKLSREAVTPGSEAMEQIRKVFGPEIFLPDGNLDREKTAKIVFPTRTSVMLWRASFIPTCGGARKRGSSRRRRTATGWRCWICRCSWRSAGSSGRKRCGS